MICIYSYAVKIVHGLLAVGQLGSGFFFSLFTANCPRAGENITIQDI